MLIPGTRVAAPGPPASGLWVGAVAQSARRLGVKLAAGWLGFVSVIAVLAPLIASGHPIVLRELASDGRVVRTTFPLLTHLSAADLLVLAWTLAVVVTLAVPMPMGRAERVRVLGLAAAQLVTSLVLAFAAGTWAGGSLGTAGLIAAVGAAPFLGWAMVRRSRGRMVVACGAMLLCGTVLWQRGEPPLARFDYRPREAAGLIRCTYTLIPFSPQEGDPSRYLKPPGSRLAVRDGSGPRFILGTDPIGQDVLSQMLHACRLAISIGLVSTGIAVSIGITIGAVAGYCGGWVDAVLQRCIETFMAIPVLFLLIVTAGLLPPGMRSTYATMAVIGAVSWTGAARFTRAEFYRLRGQDFVLAARAAGLPLRSILFRHMLPSGVTPVLVDASFSIAAAILAEATLSFLGLGPIDQPSWGKLLAGATGSTGEFVWWLAAFPGGAIFVTVLSYNAIGQALRDAMDPRAGAGRVGTLERTGAD